MTQKKFWLAITFSIFVFSLLGWIYIVLNSEVHRQTLGLQLTHFTKWPHEDTFGEMCFLVSFVSFTTWNLIKASMPSSSRPSGK